MFHSILLVVPMPDAKNESACRLWSILLDDIAQIASKYKGIQILGRNVLLIDVNENLSELSMVVSQLCCTGGQDWSYKYLIFDEEVKWHEVVNSL